MPQAAQAFVTPPAPHQAKQSEAQPSPPPLFHKHWDGAIKRFLEAAGLIQALRGFESDMLVMSSEWEHERLPVALAALRQDLQVSCTMPE